MPSAIISAFILSLLAAQRDWHLKTNLKGLFWVIAGLVFVLTMLFSSQVANIKVLDEKQITNYNSLNYVGNNILLGQSGIDINNNKINLSDGYSGSNIIPFTSKEGYNDSTYPFRGKLLKKYDNDLYSFNIIAYFRKNRKGTSDVSTYEKVYLRNYKYTEYGWSQVSELDISNMLSNLDYANDWKHSLRICE